MRTKRANHWAPAAVIGLCMAAGVATLARWAEGRPIMEIKNWNCTTTSCGAAGNGLCNSGQSMCCCSDGKVPPVHTPGCQDGGDCGGDSKCTLCS